MNEYGIGVIIILLIVAYAVASFGGYLTGKGAFGFESNSGMSSQYTGASSGVMPGPGPNTGEVFSRIDGTQTVPSNISNPSDLLPNDANSQWAQLNPNGKGELANINLLKAGYHIGIDTIGQTLRNANLQIRSEPPNPQVYSGPWNQSTITPDFLRVPLEIGAGSQ